MAGKPLVPLPSELPRDGWEIVEIVEQEPAMIEEDVDCLLYTSPSPRDLSTSRMPSSA